jgi:thymidylate synthase
MKQYLDLLEKIISVGTAKPAARKNMPRTIGLSFANITMNIDDGFPLLTTKRMFFKGIVTELIWFLRGDTNIKYLIENNTNIWNLNAYRWYEKQCDLHNHLKFTFSEFIETVKNSHDLRYFDNYSLGDLGKVYGYQWRNQNGVNQVFDIYEGLIKNPFSRYHILDAWNKADFEEMALPPCHLLYQFICRKNNQDNNVLDLNMYQRSCDFFLGVPFNLASMALFLMIMAKATNMIPGVLNWIGGDTHLYMPHIPKALIQLERNPDPLPTVIINKELKSFQDMINLEFTDFELLDYSPAPIINAELYG